MHEGDQLPDLSGTTTDGSTLKLADLAGHWLVVYFYPRDNTPGCTREAQNFRDLGDEFKARDARIVGVSRDSVASHQRFTSKQSIPYPLVSDTDEAWCKAFDVIGKKMLYGKVHLGIVRSTFLFNPAGQCVGEWRKVKVPGHAQAVLDAIDAHAA